MRYKLILLLLMLIMPYFGSVKIFSDNRPIAIGFGEKERYVLYENGYVYSLNNLDYVGRIDINKDLANLYLIDFEIISNILYLYAYKNFNSSSGETNIMLFNVKSGKKIFDRIYRFNIIDRVIIGDIVLIAIATEKGFAIMKTNSTHALIEVYRVANNNVTHVHTFDGRITAFIYRYNDTLLAAIPSTEYGINDSRKIPKVVDIFENRSLFSLPSLLPVLALAHPFIQIYNRRGNWECYITVYNPIKNRIEHYVVFPEKYDLIEYNEVLVSPYMNYAIIKYKNSTKIMFKDDTNITINYRLSIIPQGAYMAFNSINGILDVDIEKKALLVKITENSNARIIYIEGGRIIELLKLNASEADKTKGFYGAISNEKIYIISNNTLTVIETKDLNRENLNREIKYYTWISLIIVIPIVLILLLVIIKRYYKDHESEIYSTVR